MKMKKKTREKGEKRRGGFGTRSGKKREGESSKVWK